MKAATKKKRISLAEQSPELTKEWDLTKNGDLMPETVAAYSDKKVWWICSLCGYSWAAIIKNRSNGSGCPFCSGKRIKKGINDLATLCPDLINEWDFEKNKDVDPSSVGKGSQKLVWWKCFYGHSWKTAIRNRAERCSGCPYCSGKKILKGFNDFATLCPSLLDEWDYKNNTVQPNEIGLGNEKVWWICKQCGYKWEATVSNRRKGSGCPECAKRRVAQKNATAESRDSFAALFPDLLCEWDYSKNSEDPQKVHSHAQKKVWWVCRVHNYSYQASVANRSNGSGCPVCANKVVLRGINDFESWCIHNDKTYLLKEWDSEKNICSPAEISPFSGKKVHWICPKGHKFTCVLSNRTGNNTGCPVCKAHFRTSFPEQAILFYVRQYYPDAVNSYSDKKKGISELDIFLPSLNVAIEYDGAHWHTSNAENEHRKNLQCKANGIKLIRVRENGLSESEDCTNVFADPRINESMDRAITIILNLLGIEPSNVDVDRDTAAIVEQFDANEKRNSIAARFPNLLHEWDYGKNGNIDPAQVNYGSTRKFWWICPQCGQSYLRSANARTNQNQGCPNKACVDEKRNSSVSAYWITKNGSLSDAFPLVAQEWDQMKNGDLSPAQVTRFSHKKVWWICPKGHSYEAEIGNRTGNGTGCPYCSGRKKQTNDTSL